MRGFINGIVFGITEIIPGVSGGTIAIILGFYDELIGAVNHFTEDVRRHLRYIAPIAVGMVIGLVGFGSLIHFLLARFSLPTMLFFVGLVIGIIPLVFNRVLPANRKKPFNWAFTLVPIVLLALSANVKGASVADAALAVAGIDAPYMLFIFVSGIFAAAALVLPGVSGSFVLLLLGVYPLVTFTMSNISLWLTDMGNTALLITVAKVLAPLGAGVIIGGLLMARLMETLFKHHEMIIYSVILGLLLGSVYALFRNPIVYQSGVSVVTVSAGMLTFAAGCAISFLLGRKKL